MIISNSKNKCLYFMAMLHFTKKKRKEKKIPQSK